VLPVLGGARADEARSRLLREARAAASLEHQHVVARGVRSQVDLLGLSTNLMLPTPKASLGLKAFKEYWSTSTFNGYSLQIAGAIGF
jgi:hypothetical protein